MSSDFIIRYAIYLICFGINLYAFRALNYSKFIKANRVMEAQVLYIVLSLISTYLLGSFILSMLH